MSSSLRSSKCLITSKQQLPLQRTTNAFTTRASKSSITNSHHAITRSTPTLGVGSRFFTPPPRHTSKPTTTTTAAAATDATNIDDDALDRRLSRALFLAFSASQTRSLFAAKCLIETLIEAYRLGVTITEIQIALTMSLLETGVQINTMDQDLLLAWCSIVLSTLQTVGIPLYKAGEERRKRRGGGDGTTDTSNVALGLRGFVQAIVDRYLQGMTLARLQLQQNMDDPSAVEDEEARSTRPSPSVMVMQQNTRLVIITLDVIRSLGLPTVVPLIPTAAPESILVNDGDDEEQEETEEASTTTSDTSSSSSTTSPSPPPPSQPTELPVGYVSAFFSHNNDTTTSSNTESEAIATLRANAVRLLIGFTGAELGYLANARDFINTSAQCYIQGWSAGELYNQLKEEEFSQIGGIPFISVANLPESGNVSSMLFARWVSIVYITLAKMGVRHPNAATQIGWAWIDLPNVVDSAGNAFEAHKVADFVGNTLYQLEKDDIAAGQSSDSGSYDREDGEGESGLVTKPGFGLGLQDDQLKSTSPFVLMMQREASIVVITRELAKGWEAQQRGAAGEDVPSS